MYTAMARRLFIGVIASAIALSSLVAQPLTLADNAAVTGARGASDALVRGVITAPISTGFATYRPYPLSRYRSSVGLTEAAPKGDFSNVSTAVPISFDSYFSDGERAILLREGFVARPEGLGNFGAAYAHEVSSRQMGSFVTVDAVAHGLRVTVDEALRDLEIGYATDAMVVEFATLSEDIAHQLDGAGSPVVQRSLEGLLGYAQTGQYLLNPALGLDPRVAKEVRDEVRKINAASGPAESSVLPGLQIDYSLFRPAGRYAADDRRTAFFRARQWSARVPFVLRDESGNVDAESARRAFLLTQTIASLAERFDFDERRQPLDEAIAFLTGGAEDSYLWSTVSSAARRYYGLLARMGTAWLDSDAEIVSLTNYLGEGKTSGMPILFRLHAWSDGREGEPMAEFVRVASTNVSAYRSLFGLQRGETSESWLSSIRRSFVYVSQPLALDNNGDTGLPRFMRGNGWRYRGLASALGVAADIVLPPSTITMKSLPKASRYGGESAIGTDGYVEPNPEAWGRLASLAGYLRVGLGRVPGMIRQGLAAKLLDIERASARLMRISVTELKGGTLAPDDRDVIASMRTRVIAYETPVDPLLRQQGFTTPCVSSSRGGNGYPMAIYVIAPRNDGVQGLMLTRGAIYAYGDQVDPQGSQRRDLRPAGWTSAFVSPDRPFDVDAAKLVGLSSDLPVTPVEYTPAKGEATSTDRSAQLDVESSSISRAVGELWFRIILQRNDRPELIVTLVDGNEQVVRHMDLGRLVEKNRLELFTVGDLPEGRYALRLEDVLGNMLASARVRIVP